MQLRTPQEKAGVIMFLITLLLMVATFILTNHFKAFAEPSDSRRPEEVVMDELLSDSDDPLFSLEKSQEEIAAEKAWIEKDKFEHLFYQSLLLQTIMCRQKNDGTILYHKFCREDDFGCEENVRLYSKYIIKYAEEFNLSPWLLAAVAKHESNFDAYAVGAKGERGIFQLLPYSPWGKKSKFATDEDYRKFCRKIPGHCQDTVTGIAAQLIRNSIDECKSLRGGLTSYNIGECGPIYRKYVDAIMKEQSILKHKKSAVRWCTGEEL